MKIDTVVLVESPRFLLHAELLADLQNSQLVTNQEECYLKLSDLGYELLLLKTRSIFDCIRFKKFFNALSINRVVLVSDTSPVSIWIQKNFKTILISDDAVIGVETFSVNVFKNHFIKKNSIQVRFFQLLSYAKTIIDNQLYFRIEHSVKGSIFFFIQRLIFGNEYTYNYLPGRHASIISVVNENIRKVYLDNGFSKEKIFVTGSISLDARYNQIRKINSSILQQSVDVILFTQPFNKYEIFSEFWNYEMKSFIEDCEQNNISYLLLLHPRDDRAYYEKFTSPKNIISSDRRTPEDDVELVKSAKLVVIKSTTTIYLPLLLKRPICYLNHSSFAPSQNMITFFDPEMILYKKNNISHILKNLDKNELNVLESQNFEFLKNFPHQRKTKQKIVELLNKLG